MSIRYIKNMPMSFAYKKTTQALNYFACQSGGHINKMKALKLLYFADRFHLRKYGRPITNDEYFAMNYGPVPSGAKDLVAGSDFRPDSEKAYAGQYLNTIERYELSSLSGPDCEVFSKMNFSDFLDDSTSSVEPCYALSEEERSLRREEVQELCAIHNLWN